MEPTPKDLAELSREVAAAFERIWGGKPLIGGGRTPWPPSTESMCVEAFRILTDRRFPRSAAPSQHKALLRRRWLVWTAYCPAECAFTARSPIQRFARHAIAAHLRTEHRA